MQDQPFTVGVDLTGPQVCVECGIEPFDELLVRLRLGTWVELLERLAGSCRERELRGIQLQDRVAVEPIGKVAAAHRRPQRSPLRSRLTAEPRRHSRLELRVAAFGMHGVVAGDVVALLVQDESEPERFEHPGAVGKPVMGALVEHRAVHRMQFRGRFLWTAVMLGAESDHRRTRDLQSPPFFFREREP